MTEKARKSGNLPPAPPDEAGIAAWLRANPEFFRRHPDLFLTSYASMEAKVNYIKRNLNRHVSKEQTFPLLLHFNYTTVIWPRCELLMD